MVTKRDYQKTDKNFFFGRGLEPILCKSVPSLKYLGEKVFYDF